MSAKYQAYEEYKDSGVEWLGEIPDHWQLKRVKETAILINGYPFDSKKFEAGKGMPLVRIRDIKSSKTEVGFIGKVPKESLINTGDVLIGMDGDFNVSLWAGGEAALNQRVACIRAENYYIQKFIFYILPFSMKVVNDLTYFTTVKHLSSLDILKANYSLPPKNELNKVVKFLDYETTKIDTLIEKQQQLIKLLKEKRQAVISHAVTKGLNPTNSSGTNLNSGFIAGPQGEGMDSPSSAPMRDSGVEWFGEVPEHWELVPLKYLCGFSGGGTPSKDNLSYWADGDIPWVSPKDMKTFWVSDTQDKLTDKAVEESSTNFIETGTLLMVVRSGILQRTIPIAINMVRVTLNQDMKALKFNSRMNVEYAANYILGNVDSLLLEWSKEGATVESIEQEYLSNSLVPVPPVEEQIKIVEEIKLRMDIFQKLESHAVNGISLLKERRTALISAAVTGKIDVRHHAVHPAGSANTAMDENNDL